MRVSVNAKFIIVCLVWLISSPLLAEQLTAQIKKAKLVREDGWYVLKAQLQPVVSKVAKEAIKSNIPLTWCLKIQLKQERYFHDKTLVDLNYRYNIRYHGLLNSYSLTNETTKTEKRYTSLTDALEALAEVEAIKIIPISTLQPQTTYQAAIKLEFDKEQLPAHLRPVAYLNSEWDLSSDWYLWQLKN